MTDREWKPGQLALASYKEADFWVVRSSGAGDADYWSPVSGRWPLDVPSAYCDYTPLVVINPSDRAEIEQLRDRVFDVWAAQHGRALDSSVGRGKLASALQEALHQRAALPHEHAWTLFTHVPLEDMCTCGKTRPHEHAWVRDKSKFLATNPPMAGESCECGLVRSVPLHPTASESVVHAVMYIDNVPTLLCREPITEDTVKTSVTDRATCKECRARIDGGKALDGQLKLNRIDAGSITPSRLVFPGGWADDSGVRLSLHDAPSIVVHMPADASPTHLDDVDAECRYKDAES